MYRSRILWAPEGEAAPSGAQPVTTTAPAGAPPAPATAAAAPPEADPNWLKPRLEREAQKGRAALLKELGIEDPEVAKAALRAAHDAAEASKTSEQKRLEAEQRATAAEQRIQELSKLTGQLAEQRLATLNEAQRAIVSEHLGGDAEATVKALDLLAKISEAGKPATAATPPPATTSPATAAPPPVTQTSPPDHPAIYAELKRANPFAAASYAQAHPEVYRPRA